MLAKNILLEKKISDSFLKYAAINIFKHEFLSFCLIGVICLINISVGSRCQLCSTDYIPCLFYAEQ